MALNGKVALVTGATRGVGKGIAIQLAEAGATVYITGRTLDTQIGSEIPGSLKLTIEEIKARRGKAVAVICDHQRDEACEEVIRKIEKEQGRLDILVNNAYGGSCSLIESFGKPFWQLPEKVWDDNTNVGLRSYYVCAMKAARLMVKQKSGIIINMSSWGGKTYIITPALGVRLAAIDRMTADCSLELKKHNVAMVSLWPGPVKTEIFANADIMNKVNVSGETGCLGANATLIKAYAQGETPEFVGKCIVALVQQSNIMEKTGNVITTGAIAKEFGVLDVNNRQVDDIMTRKDLWTSEANILAA